MYYAPIKAIKQQVVEILEHLQNYIKNKIEELKRKVNVRTGFMTENTSDYTVVKFTTSKKFKNCKNVYCIVVSPETGYTTSLSTP